jgi:hypothetical protein
VLLGLALANISFAECPRKCARQRILPSAKQLCPVVSEGL